MDTQVSPPTQPARITPAKPRRGRAVLFFAVLLAGVVAILWWHPWGQAGPGRPTPPPQAVGVTPIASGDLPVTISALGTVTPLATVTVQSQISGVLTAVGYTEGQDVRRGDFLAQIDPRPYQVALAQAQGTLARDQALLADAKLDLARYQTLNKQDSIARQQLDTQLALVHQDEGTVITDQAAVDAQKLNLTYCHITAPVDGRVGLRLVDPGNYVQTASTTGLVVITQVKPITVIFTVPEDSIPPIMRRLNAGASLMATAYDRTNTTKLADGVVLTVDNQIDTTTGTVKVRASFPNLDAALFPNQFVNVVLTVDTLHNAVLAPINAIQHGSPGTYVFLLNADKTVSVRQVKLGPGDAQHTVITEGLAVGDTVVTDGADRLRDGAAVFVPSAHGGGSGGAPGHRHHQQQAE